MRIHGGFLGQDGGDEILLDTYGSATHSIESTEIELAGLSACGVDLSYPATLIGRGITVTANNTDVLINSNRITQTSYSGISTAGGIVQIGGNNIRLNGAAGLSGELSGIFVLGGNYMMTGNSINGNPIGVLLHTDNHLINGNNITQNSALCLLF